MYALNFLIFIMVLCYSFVSMAHDQSYYRLSKIKNPIKGESRSVGSYANGCLIGGKKLPINGDGFQLMRLSRKRYYVHDNLYNFIINFAKDIKQTHPFQGIVVGDAGQAVGGPMQSGHASHQVGLDIDIWLRPLFDHTLSTHERETISATSHVTRRQKIRDSWKKDHTNFVLKAARYSNVARIFVNPAIKHAICQHSNWKKDLIALSKIRPWYGHDSHMHVRLKCPKSSYDCIDQAPPVMQHGCKGHDINWWFSKEALKPTKKKKSVSKTFADLPTQCQKLSM